MAASRIYDIAEASLISQKEYVLCGKFLDPKKRLELAVESYGSMLQFESERSSPGPRPPEFARKAFVQRTTTLVALLVKNNRTEEAIWVADAARLHQNDRPFKIDLDSALAGNVPPPWR